MVPEGKRILVRVDYNVPISITSENRVRILDDSRIMAHMDTVEKLVENGNSVVLVSHQGRPGTSDFTSLEHHARVASRVYGYDIKWIPDVAGPYAIGQIKDLKKGEVLLLDNIRLCSEELIEAPGLTHSRSILVSRLAPLFDYYVNDAFATSHRSQASIVGFPYVVPGMAGALMEKELDAVSRIFGPEEEPKVFVLGGGKVYDTIKIIEHLYKNRVAERILTGGLVAEIFLVAKGINLGRDNLELLESRGILSLVPRARRLLLKGAPIETPIDFVTLKNNTALNTPSYNVSGLIRDIGENTVRMYSELIREARLIVFRGPLGVIEDKRFRKGTEGVLSAALDSSAFVIIGGGHMNVMTRSIERDLRRVHMSTGGAALLTLLAGEPLPALDALRESYERFWKVK